MRYNLKSAETHFKEWAPHEIRLFQQAIQTGNQDLAISIGKSFIEHIDCHYPILNENTVFKMHQRELNKAYYQSGTSFVRNLRIERFRCRNIYDTFKTRKLNRVQGIIMEGDSFAFDKELFFLSDFLRQQHDVGYYHTNYMKRVPGHDKLLQVHVVNMNNMSNGGFFETFNGITSDSPLMKDLTTNICFEEMSHPYSFFSRS